MPQHNRFQHQAYPTKPVVAPTFHHLRHDESDDDDFSRLHTEFDVSHVILVHGTFMGDDSFAIAEILEAVGDEAGFLEAPLDAVAAAVRKRSRQITGDLVKDVGNYTDEFIERFQSLVGDDPLVERLDPTWSGQNHHFARADLAVRLLNRLNDLDPHEDQTVLLWGHSHAGNGFALLTNLLANDQSAVEKFFAAAGSDLPKHWKRAQEILNTVSGPHPLARSLRIVTFGTPVRYGWDTDGYRSLLHVSHHIVDDEDKPLQAHPLFPLQSLPDVFSARYGDWVQTFGISGTDVAPPTMSQQQTDYDALLEGGLEEPDHGLDTQFIPSARLRNLCARWKTGTRCHEDGGNLLVTYEPCGRQTTLGVSIESSLLGHGVATAVDWLPRHLALVLDAMNSTADEQN